MTLKITLFSSSPFLLFSRSPRFPSLFSRQYPSSPSSSILSSRSLSPIFCFPTLLRFPDPLVSFICASTTSQRPISRSFPAAGAKETMSIWASSASTISQKAATRILSRFLCRTSSTRSSSDWNPRCTWMWARDFPRRSALPSISTSSEASPARRCFRLRLFRNFSSRNTSPIWARWFKSNSQTGNASSKRWEAKWPKRISISPSGKTRCSRCFVRSRSSGAWISPHRRCLYLIGTESRVWLHFTPSNRSIFRVALRLSSHIQFQTRVQERFSHWAILSPASFLSSALCSGSKRPPRSSTRFRGIRCRWRIRCFPNSPRKTCSKDWTRCFKSCRAITSKRFDCSIEKCRCFQSLPSRCCISRSFISRHSADSGSAFRSFTFSPHSHISSHTKQTSSPSEWNAS